MDETLEPVLWVGETCNQRNRQFTLVITDGTPQHSQTLLLHRFREPYRTLVTFTNLVRSTTNTDRISLGGGSLFELRRVSVPLRSHCTRSVPASLSEECSSHQIVRTVWETLYYTGPVGK